MKKILPIFLLILSFSVFGSSISITSQNGSISLVTNLNKVKFLATVKQDSDGRLGLSSSPVFSYSDKDVYFGELNINNYQVQSVTTPSQNPKLVGFAYKKKNLTLFVSNPVFCPSADKAVGLIIKRSSSIFGFVIDKPIQSNNDSNEYQLEWKKVKQRTCSPIVSFNVSQDLLKHIIKFEATYNKNQLVRISLAKNNIELSYSKNLEDKVKQEIELLINGFLSSKFLFTKEKQSNYSGENQSGEISFENTLSIYNLKLNVTSTNQYSKDGSKESTTKAEIKYSNRSFTSSVSTTLVRTTNTKEGLTLANLEFNSNNVSFEIKNNKAYLTLKYSEKVGRFKISISITQNRKYTFSVTVN